jgi:hypothetical protein
MPYNLWELFFIVNKETRIRPTPKKIRTRSSLTIFICPRDSGGIKSHDIKIRTLKKIEPIPVVVITMPTLSLKVRTSLFTINPLLKQLT